MKTTSFFERRIRLDPFFEASGARFNPADRGQSDATFEEIAFVNFSYSGLIDWKDLPRISRPQVVSGERIMFGFESAVEDNLLSFRSKAWSEF